MSETLFPNASTLQHNAACVDCICMIMLGHMVVYSYILAASRPDLHACKIHGEEIAATRAFIVVNGVDDFEVARLAM